LFLEETTKKPEACMRDYNGKKIYLGIDVHKKTYAVSAISDGRLVKKDTLVADPAKLVEYCRRYFPGAEIETAYEAGFCGFHLHRHLEMNNIKSQVIHAAGIEIAVGDRVKTDKRDSLKLATQLSVGRLKGIHVPSKEREGYRSLTRLRETCLTHRTRFGCQLKSLLFQHGLIAADDDQKVSEKWVKKIQERSPPEIRYAIEQYADMWLDMTKRIKEIDKEISNQAGRDQDLEMMYTSVPGIGPLAGRILANELGDMSQFANERQLFSYVGLTPWEHSSGERVRHGHISRQGKPILRKVLVQAAWVAIRYDSSLKEIYERIGKTAGKKRAIVGIARRLIGRIRACFRTGEIYKTQRKIESETAPVPSYVELLGAASDCA
jgi:transposase